MTVFLCSLNAFRRNARSVYNIIKKKPLPVSFPTGETPPRALARTRHNVDFIFVFFFFDNKNVFFSFSLLLLFRRLRLLNSSGNTAYTRTHTIVTAGKETACAVR